MATTSMQAAQLIGWPESRIILSQCAIYLATSPKNNSSYLAIGKAQQLVHETGDLPRTAAPAQCAHQTDEGHRLREGLWLQP